MKACQFFIWIYLLRYIIDIISNNKLCNISNYFFKILNKSIDKYRSS
uniref:Uncharacterized protein n=1 Tax=CrAss-like virus sp. ctYsL76 TaxID=2826826 RepID=A0A8S5QMC0_9CAUD|nr:MAG TPA: hypothetical protein [CrAss-like virus sp. ctYsL76]